MLRAALDAGINFIDTAPVYGADGVGETLLADVLAADRGDIVLTTKCGYDIAAERRNGTQRERPHDFRPESVRKQLEDSLTRLGTDYIDLYQTHWPDPELPYDETMEGLTRAVAEGKVRVVGCSNESAYGLTKSLWASDAGGFVRHETIQNNFSLLNRRFEDALAEVCRREKVSLIPYSPIAGGVLSGK